MVVRPTKKQSFGLWPSRSNALADVAGVPAPTSTGQHGAIVEHLGEQSQLWVRLRDVRVHRRRGVGHRDFESWLRSAQGAVRFGHDARTRSTFGAGATRVHTHIANRGRRRGAKVRGVVLVSGIPSVVLSRLV